LRRRGTCHWATIPVLNRPEEFLHFIEHGKGNIRKVFSTRARGNTQSALRWTRKLWKLLIGKDYNWRCPSFKGMTIAHMFPDEFSHQPENCRHDWNIGYLSGYSGFS
jgi:hypothetical protein